MYPFDLVIARATAHFGSILQAHAACCLPVDFAVRLFLFIAITAHHMRLGSDSPNLWRKWPGVIAG